MHVHICFVTWFLAGGLAGLPGPPENVTTKSVYFFYCWFFGGGSGWRPPRDFVLRFDLVLILRLFVCLIFFYYQFLAGVLGGRPGPPGTLCLLLVCVFAF